MQYILQEHLHEDGHNRWPKHVAVHAVYNTMNLRICICVVSRISHKELRHNFCST